MNNNQPWHKYPLIKDELNKVNHCIEEQIHLPYPELEKALQEMAQNGGKYLRPTLLILAAKASGQDEIGQNIIQVASSIEILHMATLIHDDVIDDSDKRRGAISIQARFGKDTAVYAGDFLFTKFFDLILKSELNHQYMIQNAKTMRHILDGELNQMAERFNLNQKYSDYLANIKGKTAALFRLAAQEGAYLANASSEVSAALSHYGENLGIAFQMIDDILDYTGSQKLNKPTLEDLATGVYSLPLLIALDSDLRPELEPILAKNQAMTLEDIDQIQAIVLNSAAIEKSRQIARQYSQAALDNLQVLPNTSAKKLLIQMTKKLLTRTI